jgi:transcriptional regulator
MLLDPEPAPLGTLLCHVARDNPQWRSAGEGESLAIFLGPDAYVSPSTYATKTRNPAVVPTWNYVAIHAYGRLAWFDDEARLRDLVTRLTQRQEAAQAEPWAVTDAPDKYVRAMLQAIVGLALPIARLEGKWKMSQNRPPEDRASAADALRRDGNEAVSSLITKASKSQ